VVRLHGMCPMAGACACMACAGACMACAGACMAGTVACPLQHTPWHTPAVCGHGVCWRLHGRCLRLHGRCHGRCFVANAMAHATGLWPWRVLALAWRVLALAWRVLVLAWQVLCTWQVRWQHTCLRWRRTWLLRITLSDVQVNSIIRWKICGLLTRLYI
jgi:hypothetical protein